MTTWFIDELRLGRSTYSIVWRGRAVWIQPVTLQGQTVARGGSWLDDKSVRIYGFFQERFVYATVLFFMNITCLMHYTLRGIGHTKHMLEPVN